MVHDGTRSRVVALCFDARDPVGLARFWAAALRWEIDAAGPGIALASTDGTAFPVVFRPSDQPRTGLGRIHLDLTSSSLDDQDGTVASLLELGARHLDVGQRPEEDHVVLADPEGNEFCVVGPGNTFLAGCGRLGAINCDGTREVGLFWSQALGWPLIWDQDEETAIRAPDGAGPIISWGGPPVAPKSGRNRLHLDLATHDDGDPQAELDRLVALGATYDAPGDAGWVDLLDPDGNEFRLLRR